MNTDYTDYEPDQTPIPPWLAWLIMIGFAVALIVCGWAFMDAVVGNDFNAG